MSSHSPSRKKTPFHFVALFLIIPLTCISALLSSISLARYVISRYKVFVNYLEERVDPSGKAVFVTGESCINQDKDILIPTVTCFPSMTLMAAQRASRNWAS